MTKRKNPPTSNDALRSLSPAHLAEVYVNILFALKHIEEGTQENIASFLGVPPDTIWKRLPELVKAGKIYKPGNKRPLKSGRNGFTYRLTSPSESTEPITEKVPAGPSVVDFSRKLIPKQTQLF